MKLLRVMQKDLRLIVRDRVALVFLLLVPMVVIAVVAETQGGNGSDSIVFPIVNEDQGPVAAALIKVFRQHLDVREVDAATAKRLVAVENTAPALLVLPAGMSRRYLAEKPSTVELLTDPAQAAALQAVKAILLLAERETASLADPIGEELLTIAEHNIAGRRLEFSSLEQSVPGFSLMFVLLDLIFSVAFGLRDEEVWGTSRRLAMAPVSHRAVIGGKLLARVIVGTIQLLSLLLFGHLMYGVPLGESLGTLFLLTVAVVASMGCFSLLVAAVARSPEQIVPVGLTAVFILAAIGGCWWPFFEQPRWMQTLGEGMLTTWSMRALQDVLLRGKGLLEITPELLVLVAYGLVSLGVGLRVFRYAET